MKVAIITVVIDDADGVDVQKIIEAKTTKGLKSALKSELPKIVRNFHNDNPALEEEDDEYIDDVVEDLLSGEYESDVYCPSGYKGSGFVQVKDI
jgi:hypothetical protein